MLHLSFCFLFPFMTTHPVELVLLLCLGSCSMSISSCKSLRCSRNILPYMSLAALLHCFSISMGAKIVSLFDVAFNQHRWQRQNVKWKGNVLFCSISNVFRILSHIFAISQNFPRQAAELYIRFMFATLGYPLLAAKTFPASSCHVCSYSVDTYTDTNACTYLNIHQACTLTLTHSLFAVHIYEYKLWNLH